MTPFTIRQGVLKDWDSGNYYADVQLLGSLSTFLTNVPVTRGLQDADMVTDRYVAVLFFDENNQENAVVIAVYTQ